MLDLLTLLEFVKEVFVQFTLEFFKGSMILRCAHVCKVCWVITLKTWKTPKPIILIGNYQDANVISGNLANYVISLLMKKMAAVGLHRFVVMTIPQKYGLYVME